MRTVFLAWVLIILFGGCSGTKGKDAKKNLELQTAETSQVSPRLKVEFFTHGLVKTVSYTYMEDGISITAPDYLAEDLPFYCYDPSFKETLTVRLYPEVQLQLQDKTKSGMVKDSPVLEDSSEPENPVSSIDPIPNPVFSFPILDQSEISSGCNKRVEVNYTSNDGKLDARIEIIEE